MSLQAQRPSIVNPGARIGRARRTERQSLSTRFSAPIAKCVPTGLRYWRPFPREVEDVIFGEAVSAALPTRTHDAVQLLLPGSPVVVTDGARADRVVRPGQVHLAAPQELHSVRTFDGAACVMRVLLIGPATLARLRCDSAEAWSKARDGERHRVVDDAADYAELWRFVDDLRRPVVAADEVQRLLECLRRLLAAGSEPPPAHSARASLAQSGSGVARVRDHLRAHIGESVSLVELADVAGLSKHYLLRAFRRAYGVTPHEFQMQLRLGLAWRMILDGFSLTRATYDAGFADQSHLTRRFAAAFGLPPARYARLLDVPPTARSERAADHSQKKTSRSAA